MRVKELIEELKNQPPDDIVVVDRATECLLVGDSEVEIEVNG